MPNNCTTHMQVHPKEGDEAILRKFKKAIRGPQLPPDEYYKETREMYIDFDKIVPQPPEVLATTELQIGYGTPEADSPNYWYKWRCKNWGTKWNAYYQEVTQDIPEEYAIQFDTAWGPPYPIFRALKEQWPDLDFGGGGFTEGFDGEHDLDDDPEAQVGYIDD